MSKPKVDDIFRSLGAGLRFQKPASAKKSASHREFLVSEEGKASAVKVKEIESGDEDDLPVVSDDEDTNTIEATTVSKMKVKIDGDNPPEPVSTFSALALHAWLQQNIAAMGWKKPTLVQSASLPTVLQQRDVIVASPTGSGKTGSYLIPILQASQPITPEYENQQKNASVSTNASPKVDAKSKKSKKQQKQSTEQQVASPITTSSCRTIIVAPIRELGQQIYSQLRKLTAGQDLKILLLTRQPKGSKSEEASMPDGTSGPWDIVISTPQRLIHYVEKSLLTLSHLRHIVFDEVDRLLGNDLIQQIDTILTKCKEATKDRDPSDRLKIGMFTATFTPAVEGIAKSALVNPIRVVIGIRNTAVANVEQSFKFTGTEEGKLMTMRNMINGGEIRPPCLVFMQSKDRAMDLYQQLSGENVPVDIVTGERSDAQRDRAIHGFRTGAVWILITTDLLARGMDFPAVHTVINYDLPPTPSQYIHRVGRAGRANQHGRTKQTATAQTLITETDIPYLKPFINVVVSSGYAKNIPQWLLKMDKIDRKHKKEIQKGKAIARDAIDPIKAAKNRKLDARKRKRQDRDGKSDHQANKKRKTQ